MPITPFHFGPGAAIHAIAPKRVSFIAFCTANILIDVEPLYYMSTGQFPLHRFFHTYIGATLMASLVVALFLASRSLRLPNLFDWRNLSVASVALGAVFGSSTHVIFDSIMHADIRPFAPFSDANPLLGAVPLETLHWSCALAGVIGMAILLLRRRRGASA